MKPDVLPADSPDSLASPAKPEPLSFSANSAQKKFLETFAEGRINYWSSFATDSFVAAFFLAWPVVWRPVSWPVVLLLAAAGWVLWGLSEYVFHRWAYHAKRGIFGSGHRMHHDEEKAYVAMPWFVSGFVVFAVWYGVVYYPGDHALSALFGGWMAGFVFYSWVHHAHHHWSLQNGWMRRLRAHHRVHHRFPDRNFGVTLRFWDEVFGTRQSLSSARPAKVMRSLRDG